MHTRLSRLLLSTLIGLAAAALWLLLLAPAATLSAAPQASHPAQPVSTGRTFTVTSAADISDLHPGDGVCDTTESLHVCTLRAAIQEVDRGPGGDTVLLKAHTLYLLTQAGAINPIYDGNLNISQTVTLLGAGPDSTIIDGNGSLTGERVFDIMTGTVVISGVTIQNGMAYNEGGNILTSGALTVINSHILSGTADGLNDFGGGIATGGALTVTNSLVRGNQTGSHGARGGGLMNFGGGLATIISSTIIDNLTVADSMNHNGLGGGVAGEARIVNSTISSNTAQRGGGAYLGGNSIVINSTIAGNHATGAGGGLFSFAGSVDLYNVTVTDNQANSDAADPPGNGGGVAVETSALTFINSIIFGNTQIVTSPGLFLFADNCSGTVSAAGFDLLGDNDNPLPHCTVNGSPSSADPLLGPLQDNGGPTLTQALLPGSPAINSGNPSGCTDNVGALITTDQRGRARPAPGHGLCDIGAYEFPQLLYLPLLRR